MGRALPPGNPRAALEAGVGMVHQHFTLADNLTVLENIVLGTRAALAAAASGAARRGRASATSPRRFGLEVDPDARVGDLTVGQRQRVEILKALYRDARILILDEPTAVLTPQETRGAVPHAAARGRRGARRWCSSRHKLGEVMAVSDRVLVLRHGRLVGEVATRDTDRHELARLMVGAEIAPPAIPPVPRRAGAAGARAGSRRRTAAACPGCARSTWRCAAGGSPGWPGSRATARRRSPS